MAPNTIETFEIAGNYNSMIKIEGPGEEMVETSAGNVRKELTKKVSPPELIIRYASQDWDGNSLVEVKFRLQRCCRRGHRDSAPELRPEYGRSVCQR